MSHTYYQIRHHVVFSTKDRRRCLAQEWEERLFAYIGTVLADEGAVLLSAGAGDDHIHLLIGMKPTHAPADLVGKVKANSSRWVKETIAGVGDFAWQTGYGIFSVSHSSFDEVVAYLRGQRERHQRVSFEDEFRAILKRHGLEWDERYVWG